MLKQSKTQSFFLKAKSYKLKAAFTLVEMIIAFGVFAVIMVTSVGSLLSLMQANYTSQTLKTVVNNLYFALENVSRNLRTGRIYHCNLTGDLRQPADCASEGASALAFTSRDGRLFAYRHRGTQIERSTDGGATFIPITAPEITVERFRFFVDGAAADDNRQPRVLILAGGTMQGRGKVPSRFEIETLVSQRQLDI